VIISARLTKNHTGEYLAEELEKSLRSFGIEKNVGCSII
jgi:hypothetical protein